MIKAIIIGSKKASVEVLNNIFLGYPFINIVESFDEPDEAEEYVYNNNTDIAFIDIEMQNTKSEKLKDIIGRMVGNNCIAVFISAYGDDSSGRFTYSKDKVCYTIGNVTRILKVKEPVKVRCFDSFKILFGNEEVRFRTNKATELIAFLIHKQGKSVSRSEIIDNLWTDFEGDRALINFNTTLSYVKKALSLYQVDLPIAFDRGSYKIDISNLDCDYYTFMDCNLERKSVNEDMIEYYEKMLALYSGDYFNANEYHWAENRRLFLKDKYVRMFLIVAQYYETRNNLPKVIELLETSVMNVPLNREITYYLIKALINEGNYSLALSYFKMHRDALHDELNIDPDVSLKRLMGYA